MRCIWFVIFGVLIGLLIAKFANERTMCYNVWYSTQDGNGDASNPFDGIYFGQALEAIEKSCGTFEYETDSCIDDRHYAG